MKSRDVEFQDLPSVEDTKLGNILNELPDEVRDVKDSILHISQKYRQDLTSQLEQSYKFEQHLARNFKKINKKSKRLHQKGESLNTSLNKSLDQLKSYDELNDISTNITDSIFGILESLTKIEMILPYNERLGVRDSPHRVHYPNLYKLMNPNDNNNDNDEDTIREDELSSFEQLDIQTQEDYNEADESSNGEVESAGEEEQEEIEDNEGMELQPVLPSEEDVRSDTIEPATEADNEAPLGTTTKHSEEELPLVQEGSNICENSPESIKVSENTKEEEPEQTDNDLDKQIELESVIDNYKLTKDLKQQQQRTLRPVRSSIPIPSLSNASVSPTTGLTTNHDFPQQINTAMPTQAQGTIVSAASSSQGSSLTDDLKKFIGQNKSFSSGNISS